MVFSSSIGYRSAAKAIDVLVGRAILAHVLPELLDRDRVVA
jgi:hypothetical protein